MIYSFSVATLANTKQADRIRTKLKLTKGIVHQLDIVFPAGCAGLTYIAIQDGLHQVWPTNPDEYFHTDGETISFPTFYELSTDPHELIAYTYNLDDTYPHELIVRLGVLRVEELAALTGREVNDAERLVQEASKAAQEIGRIRSIFNRLLGIGGP